MSILGAGLKTSVLLLFAALGWCLAMIVRGYAPVALPAAAGVVFALWIFLALDEIVTQMDAAR